jgi:4-amino-4-deoxy-L-arabinose transferase-like glycosyltransferase
VAVPARDVRTIAGLALLAAVVRIGYWLATADDFLKSDALQYHRLATNVAQGDGLSETFPAVTEHATAFRPPIFPLLLGGWYRVVGNSVFAGRAFAVLLGVVLVVLVYVIVRRHANDVAALAAAVLVAVFPPLVANDTVPLTETLSLILLLLLVDAVVRSRPAWCGVWCGLLTLTRPSAQLLILLVVLFLVRAVGWRRTLLSLAIFLAVLTPWVVRNWIQVGRPVLVTSNGFNLAAMHSDEAYEAGDFIDPVYHPGFDDLRLTQFDEAEWDAALQRRALEDIADHPTRVFGVVGRNFLYFFELQPGENDDAELVDGRNLTIRHWTLPLFYVVVVLGVVGLWRERRSRFSQVLLVVGAYFAVASLVFVAPPRLRAPVDLVLCIGVGLLAAQLWRARAVRTRTRDAPTPTTRSPHLDAPR